MREEIKKYLEWKGTYALRASESYRIWLEKFLQVCGDKPISEYSIADYVKYNKYIERNHSPGSVQYSTIVIKNFFRFYKEQNVPCIPPSLIKIPRCISKSHRAVNEDEYKKIIQQIPENDFQTLRDLVIIRLLWDTGMRVSELCDLNISQINKKTNTAVINTKKNGHQRIIVWSDDTQHLLIKYLGIRMELDEINNASAIFVSFPNTDRWDLRIKPRTVQRIVRKYVKYAGLKEKITPHSFRHGWAHVRRDQNAPLAFIQRGLGHLNPLSTFIYEQYNDNEFIKHAQNYLSFV